MMHLASRPFGSVTPISALSREWQIPESYLRKIIPLLAKAAVVHSRRGKGGGLVLARRAEEITFLDVIEAVEGDWRAEYLDLILAVKVVDGVAEAVAHINKYSSAHTDAIVTRASAAADAPHLIAYRSWPPAGCAGWTDQGLEEIEQVIANVGQTDVDLYPSDATRSGVSCL